MTRFFILTAILALFTAVQAQCGSGTPNALVTGAGGTFTATSGPRNLYTGKDYLAAIKAALDGITSGQRVAVMASGSIGAGTISIASGKIFEVCGTIDAAAARGRGAIESLDTVGAQIPFLTMTGNPTFGLRFYGTRGLVLGKITMNLRSGMGIRFERDKAGNSNVKMDSINVTGASSHAVETWNIDGLVINEVIAKNVGECGLLLQKTINAVVGLVNGDNVATGTGYATFRMANENGRLANGAYPTNVRIKKVISRGGGRGIFCVSQSGGAVVESADLANNGGNAVLIENCNNFAILGGTVKGGGEVRLSSRAEFANNRDISVTLKVDGTTVRSSPCGVNTKWKITGSAGQPTC